MARRRVAAYAGHVQAQARRDSGAHRAWLAAGAGASGRRPDRIAPTLCPESGDHSGDNARSTGAKFAGPGAVVDGTRAAAGRAIDEAGFAAAKTVGDLARPAPGAPTVERA